jgi:adenylate cyclase
VHFEAARDTRRAIAYHEQAGDVALARHAGHEAVEQLNACRRLVTELPDGPDRTQLEMTLLMKLAAPLMSIKGWAARELEEVLVRAHALSRRVDEEPHLFPLLRGLVSFYQVRGEAPMARAFGEEMLALCARVPDPLAPVQAHYGQGVTLHGLAELEAAEVHLRRALALYDPATHRAHVQTYGDYDPGVSCRCWLAWLQWFRGSPDSALRTVREAVEQASGLTHPFTLNWAHLSAAIIHLYRGEAAPALEHLTTANAIARDEGFENQLASGAAVGGWARLVDGRRQEAIVLLRDALARYRETGAQVWLPMVLAMLGVAEATSGDLDAGLRHLDEGIEVAERTTQRLLLPELYRARGNLLAGSDPARADEAAAVLERASALAQASGARMQMLQAATSLWRLRSRQGRTDEARVLLEPVYASFTEGLDLAELREAKALLDRG